MNTKTLFPALLSIVTCIAGCSGGDTSAPASPAPSPTDPTDPTAPPPTGAEPGDGPGAPPAPSTHGTLDPAFGTDGVVHLDRTPRSPRVLADGSVVLLDDTRVRRIGKDGAIDENFAAGVSVHEDAIVPLPDGRFMLFRAATGGFRRLLASGAVDASYVAPENGALMQKNVVRSPIITSSGAGAVTVAGSLVYNGHWFTMRRFLPDGRPDARFGDDKGVVDPFNDATLNRYEPVSMVLRDETAVLAAINSWTLVVAGPNGALRPSYVEGLHPTALAVDPSKRVLAAGTDRSVGLPGDLRVARLESSIGLLLDPTFGEGGVAAPGIANALGEPAITADAQGRVVVAVSTYDAENPAPVVVVRLLADGKLDPTFGEGGVAKPFPPKDTFVKALATTADGGVLVFGSDGDGGFVARLRP